jgi:hypothetical protein
MTMRRRRFARLIHSRIEPRPQTATEGVDTAPPAGEGIAAETGETLEARAGDVDVAGGEDGLADGIAEVFAALRDTVEASDDAPAAEAGGDAADNPDDRRDGATYRLLGELDRLWRRAA